MSGSQVENPDGLSSRRSRHAARHAFCLVLVLVLPGLAQNNSPPQQPRAPLPQPIGQRGGDSIYGVGSDEPGVDEDRLRMLNRERQKSMVSDAAKLLRLANELDAEIKTANPEALTASQLRKLADIEKLAHNVKDKMSYSVRGGPVFLSPPSIPR